MLCVARLGQHPAGQPLPAAGDVALWAACQAGCGQFTPEQAAGLQLSHRGCGSHDLAPAAEPSTGLMPSVHVCVQPKPADRCRRGEILWDLFSFEASVQCKLPTWVRRLMAGARGAVFPRASERGGMGMWTRQGPGHTALPLAQAAPSPPCVTPCTQAGARPGARSRAPRSQLGRVKRCGSSTAAAISAHERQNPAKPERCFREITCPTRWSRWGR